VFSGVHCRLKSRHAWIGLGVALAAPGAALGREPAPLAFPTSRAPAPSQERVQGPQPTLPSLQVTARRLLAEARPVSGGIIAIHAPSGRILAWQEYRRPGQPGHPLTSAITPAASLFKIVTTVALLERGAVTPDTRVCISGGERGIARDHLMVPEHDPNAVCNPFGQALGFSRNAAFAQLATERLLRTDLIEVAERLGFNHELAFDVPATMGTLSVPYNDLEFARTAIGFRGSRLSVLGAAQLAYAVAADGRLPRMSFEPAALLESGAPDRGVAVMHPLTARQLRQMMEVTVHSGTSREAFTTPDGKSYLGDVRAAGKTGTLRPDPKRATTSWFIGFAPSRAPELVVSVMLDNGAVWRRKANVVARDMLRAYFHDRRGVTHPYAPGADATLTASPTSAAPSRLAAPNPD
jgi:peptidoglycan glycosyltransferase